MRDKVEEKMSKKVTWKKLYSLWAEKYDSWPNVRYVIEKKGLLKMVEKVKGKNLLDLGCGTGGWSIILAKKGANVTAVDNSKEMLNVFKKKLSSDNLKINILKKDIYKLKLNKKFDIIILGLVIDNIKDLDRVFKVVKNHLKQKGIFFISDPIYFSGIKSPMAKEITILEDKYRVTQYIHPDQEIKSLAKKYGLEVVEIRKLVVDESVKHIFDKKPHKSFSEYKGKHVLTIYKFMLKKER